MSELKIDLKQHALSTLIYTLNAAFFNRVPGWFCVNPRNSSCENIQGSPWLIRLTCNVWSEGSFLRIGIGEHDYTPSNFVIYFPQLGPQCIVKVQGLTPDYIFKIDNPRRGVLEDAIEAHNALQRVAEQLRKTRGQ